MKSIVQEGSSVAKAVEKALQVAGNPREFTVKVLEEAQKNFFGMTTRSAKISLLFHATEAEKAPKVEQQRFEKPRVEKPKPEQRPRPEKKQKLTEKKPLVVEKQQFPKVEKQPKIIKEKSENQTFWTDNMVVIVRDWLNSTISEMDHAPVKFEIDINRYYLRITFAGSLDSDEGKERQIFRSFSYLILQTLRTKLQRPLRGFKIVLTRG